MLRIIQMSHIFYAIRLMNAEHVLLIQLDVMARHSTCGSGGEKILTADLADSTTAVFYLLSAALTQGNMSRLGRCELNPAA